MHIWRAGKRDIIKAFLKHQHKRGLHHEDVGNAATEPEEEEPDLRPCTFSMIVQRMRCSSRIVLPGFASSPVEILNFEKVWSPGQQ